MTNEVGFEWGTFKGTDREGNRYYEERDNNEAKSHNGILRRVVYKNQEWKQWNGASIPSEWHGWMHHTTDISPTEV